MSSFTFPTDLLENIRLICILVVPSQYNMEQRKNSRAMTNKTHRKLNINEWKHAMHG